jgi:hypothetical protein
MPLADAKTQDLGRVKPPARGIVRSHSLFAARRECLSVWHIHVPTGVRGYMSLKTVQVFGTKPRNRLVPHSRSECGAPDLPRRNAVPAGSALNAITIRLHPLHNLAMTTTIIFAASR